MSIEKFAPTITTQIAVIDNQYDVILRVVGIPTEQQARSVEATLHLLLCGAEIEVN